MKFHISSVYPPKLGGIEKVVRVLAGTQKKMGDDVAVITSDQGIRDGATPRDDFVVTRLKSFVIANTTIMPTLPSKLLRLKRDDIVHLHIAQAYAPEMVWFASKLKRFDYIAHVHLDVPASGPAGFLLRPYKSVVLRRVLRSAKFVVVFTKDQKSELCKKYGLESDRVKVIPNGVEDVFFNDEKRTLHKKPRLLFVGRLGYQKNLKQLLYALDGISDQFETTIVGDGELREELEGLAHSLKLKNVIFTGRKEGEELHDYYRRSDLFVLPSEREGMPLVLLEAMAMGLPIVATNVTGSRDVVTNSKNGLLVPYGDAEAFRKAILAVKSSNERYAEMSKAAREIAEQYSWHKVATKFAKLYTATPKTFKSSNALEGIALWKLVLPLLVLANAAYLTKDFFGWLVTLGFFLFVPGYLLLSRLEHGIKDLWEIICLSLGVSLLLLMVSGLALNSLHIFGLSRPLSTLNIFVVSDFLTFILLVLNGRKRITLSRPRIRASAEHVIATIGLTSLPLLAIGGAIRLNNGASNILTMALFVLVPTLFVLLVLRKNLKPIYPYAIFTFALSILLTTSLRGWYVTGHDIQHEFSVFSSTYNNGFWTMSGHNGDPYNACLSITILPTIIAKLTTILPVYVFKVVFQVIFALGLLPIYSLVRQFRGPKTALASTFVFILFPAFLDDMPFINRQEIAFVFFSLLVLATFRNMVHKTKTSLTFCLIFGLILSHYSSGYTVLCMLLLGWVLYRVLKWRKQLHVDAPTLPVLRLSVIVVALLFTFLWNAQITNSTSNLSSTVADTVKGLVNGSSSHDGFVQYSLLSSGTKSQTPQQVFTQYAGDKASQAHYVAWQNLPITRFGDELSKFTNVTSLNYRIHTVDAEVFQVLLLLGVVVLLVKWRKARSQTELYYCALAISCVIMLVLWTILPDISVDYTPIRLFQQSLVITAFPIVLGLEYLLSFLGKYRWYILPIFLAFLFLDLSGFVPESTGGYLPQLSLNNSGEYYDFFYTHKSDIDATEWMGMQKSDGTPVFLDTTSSSVSFLSYPTRDDILQNGGNGFLIQEDTNTGKKVYRVFLSGLSEYSDPSLGSNRNLIYTNAESDIYGTQLSAGQNQTLSKSN